MHRALTYEAKTTSGVLKRHAGIRAGLSLSLLLTTEQIFYPRALRKPEYILPPSQESATRPRLRIGRKMAFLNPGTYLPPFIRITDLSPIYRVCLQHAEGMQLVHVTSG
jgi:hypothetical protein